MNGAERRQALYILCKLTLLLWFYYFNEIHTLSNLMRMRNCNFNMAAVVAGPHRVLLFIEG